jgi:hypothetical protein
MTLEEVKAQLARVDHRVDGIAFRWHVSEAWERVPVFQDAIPSLPSHPAHVGYFVQIEYDEADIDDPHGPPLVQQGRRWFVGMGVSPDEVLQTALNAALASAEHRTREWFLVDGVRCYGPHQPASRLIQAQRQDAADRYVEGLAKAARDA